VTIEGLAVGARYGYRLGSDARLLPDPASRSQPEGVHGPSAVVDPTAFRWTDGGWRGFQMADLVFYELHVGTFTHEGTFRAAIGHLEELADLGITAIELMPIAEFPGRRNWGYDGVALYAPHSAYGAPDDLRALVDAAHARGLAVFLDVVYNHLGPEGNYLDAFGPYFTDAYTTPWGRALNFDGPDSDEVRAFFVDNARYWIEEFHFDGLRLDAVHGIRDFSARHLLADVRAAVHGVGARQERRTLVIAESDLNDPRLVRPEDVGGYGLDGQWSDDFHHAVHALLTGERNGYYEDFGDVADLAKAYAERFVYDGRHSPHRRRRHGAPAGDVRADAFVVCVQNHDQVGNRAMGDRLSTLVGFEEQKLAAALLLLAPYVPLLFMGEEYGETRPFPYFVSHSDEGLIEAVRRGRREEFASFGWSDDVPDPQSEDTFRSARLDRAGRETPRGRALLALHRDLIALRRKEAALRPGVARVRVTHDDEQRWMEARFEAPGAATLVALFNFADVERRMSFDGGSKASVLWRSTDPAYRGEGADGATREPSPTAGGLLVAPRSAALTRIEA
jgi:maltooligosyltrehalose trehalohydrolase